MSLTIVPLNLDKANEYVAQHHRHHRPVAGNKFSIGVELDGSLVGVAICGRPVARGLDTGLNLEVLRCCTDGTKNACSKLYSACARAAKAMGYQAIYTYTLDTESGHSLMAAGWELDGMTAGGTWDCASRARETQMDLIGKKKRWIKK